MHDLSLTLLDLAMNSIRANAKTISICINENWKTNTLTLTIEDDGEGINSSNLEEAFNPFYTTRNTRKIGLGLSLFSEMIDLCDGEVTLSSSMKGTTISGWMKCDHINRPQIGNLASTLSTLLMEKEVRLDFLYRFNERVVRINSTTIHEKLKEEGKTTLSNNIKIYKQLIRELEVLYGGEHEISRRFKEN